MRGLNNYCIYIYTLYTIYTFFKQQHKVFSLTHVRVSLSRILRVSCSKLIPTFLGPPLKLRDSRAAMFCLCEKMEELQYHLEMLIDYSTCAKPFLQQYIVFSMYFLKVAKCFMKTNCQKMPPWKSWKTLGPVEQHEDFPSLDRSVWDQT